MGMIVGMGITDGRAVDDSASSPDQEESRGGIGINPALLYWKALFIAQGLLHDADNPADLLAGNGTDSASQKFSQRFESVMQQLYKTSLEKAEVDWGDDLREGPNLLLPHLVTCRKLALVTRVRARVLMASDNESQVVRDLQAMYSLSARLKESPILINHLVSIAMDSLLGDILSEHLGSMSAESGDLIRTILESIAGSKSIADCVPTEKEFMAGWLHDKILSIQSDSAGDEILAMQQIGEMIIEISGGEEGFWKQLKSHANHSLSGIMDLFDSISTDFDHLGSLVRSPYPQAMTQVAQFDKSSQNHNNPIRKAFFPAFLPILSKQWNADQEKQLIQSAISAIHSPEINKNKPHTFTLNPKEKVTLTPIIHKENATTIGIVFTYHHTGITTQPTPQRFFYLHSNSTTNPTLQHILSGPKSGESQ